MHNTDTLSLAETQRIAHQLEVLDINISGLFCNHRIPDEKGQKNSNPALSWPRLMDLPYAPYPLVGLDALTRFIDEFRIDLAGVLRKSITHRLCRYPDQS